MRRIYLYILLLLLFSLNLFSQTKIDSLENQLKIMIGKEKIEVLNELAEAYLETSSKKSIEYGNKALSLAKKSKNKKQEAISLYNISLANYYKSNYKDALDCQKKSLKIRKEIDDKKGIANSLKTIGIIYYRQYNYQKALEYLQNSLEKDKELGNEIDMANSLGYIGNIHLRLNKYDEALEFYLNSLKIREKIGDNTLIAVSLNNIGSVYIYLNDYEKALEYYKKTLIIFEEIGDFSSISSVLSNIGDVYIKIKNYDKALEYTYRSVKIDEDLGKKEHYAISINNIASIYSYQKEYKKALEYYFVALEIFDEFGKKWQFANTSNNIGHIYFKLHNYEKSFKYLQQGLKLANELNSKELVKNSYINYSKLYSAKENYQKSLEYYKLYTAVKDSIFTEESSGKIAEMQIKYETEKKEKENEILKKDNKIQKLEINKQQNFRNSLIVISILILILFFVSYTRYLSKQKTNVILNQKNSLIEKTNKELNKKNKELEIHEEHISLINKILQHDLTNNLSITSSAIRLFRKSNDIKMIDEILKSTQKSIELIRNMQNLEKFLNLHSVLKLYFINDILATIVKNFDTISFNIIGRSKILADDSLSSVFENIIGNAVVHGKADSIDINILRKEKICEVRIADNGIGIPEKIRESIFDEGFKYGKDAHTGMGLFIVKKAMENYGGTISVENNKPKGTIFTLTFRRIG